jgi:hypothetical protein
MQFLRKLGLTLSLLLYMPLLLLLPTFISLNSTIINPVFVKDTLVKAKFYDGLNSFIVEEASKNQDIANNPILLASLKQAASAEALQKVVEPPIDGVYTWLDHPDQKFNVTVSFEPLKQSFVQIAQQNLQVKLTALPRCTSRAAVSADPYQATCIPPGTDVQQVINQAKAELEQNHDVLGDQENISLSDTPEVAQAQPNEQSTAKKDTPKLNTNQLKMYAKLYHWVKVGTPVVIVLTVLATLGIALLSRPYYKGVRRIGVFLIINGVLLLATSFIMAFALKTFLPVPSTEGSLSSSGTKIADILSEKVLSVSHMFTIIYLVVGVIAIIGSIVIKKTTGGSSKPAKSTASIEQENMLPEDDLKSDKPVTKIESKPAEPKSAEKAPEPKAEEPKPKTKISVE